MRLSYIFKLPKEGNNEEISEIPWHILDKMEQLDELIIESKTKSVAIFKHSTRCGISRAMKKMFERNYTLTDGQLKLYHLDLLQNRSISNKIATKFKVHHESPQIIVIKDGEVVYHDSHHAIEASNLNRFV